MGFDQLAALLGASAVVIGAVAALGKSIADIITAARKKDTTPAPQVGIPAVVSDDDIDYRAYADMKAQLSKAEQRAEKAERDRDAWMHRALGIDEDTHPT